MKKIDAIIQPFKLDEVKETLQGIGIEGMTCCIAVCMSQYDLIRDHGGSRPRQVERPQGALSSQEYTVDLLPN